MSLMMDKGSMLKELSERAARYSINLDGQVDLHKGKGIFHGSSALVYQGILRREGTRVKVAIKTFRSGPPEDLNTLKRIFREVHLWSKLSHENIVRMHGICTEFEDTISVISDWMGMGDAFTYVQNQENDPRPLLVDVANGLHYLHSHELGPILHGDLKGQNVLVSNDRRALLADFGFSTLRACTFSMTVELRCGGTLPWTAPEILEGEEASVASDIWGFGMTALELFTRLQPFYEKPNLASIMVRIVQGPPDRPSEESTCFRLTDAWWDVCSSCWKGEPLSRPRVPDIIQKLDEMMVCV
ncbi:kinase-like domain-containing protein [Scleroderma yunnanense]